ncbi:E3 ubiquitin/ISG15 ligase TRIM25-like [Saccostrea echinata]|uniref:E3 ubiquitin/ISG15 ligase TRIM25-like n=1 Tax=Saccostrea echinata TaxID=191078 RepID=UPI002A80EC0D|nr:E3 ubiquitin/ISG15 ligase TRIM25-like [Saccostrea echinata]
MATGGKILCDLKDEFCECPICTEEYDEEKHVPRLLPCQHSFCTECLKKGIKGGKLICSMCKRSYKLKEKGIDYFPKDITKRSLREIINRIAATSCHICKRLESARFECTSCNIQVCKGCFKVRKLNDCKNHQMKDVYKESNESSDSSLDSLEKHAENICNLPFHEKNALKFYCKNNDCRKPICANCTTKGHKNHDWEEIDLFYNKEKETLLARLSLAKKKIETAKGVLSYIKKENEKIMQNDRMGKETIQNEKQSGIDYLNQEVEDLCQRSTQIIKVYTDKFEKKKSFLKNFIQNAQACCSISEELLKESKLSFLSLEKTISEKLENFGKGSFPEEKSDIDIDLLLLKDECSMLKKRIEKMKDPYLEMDEHSLFEITPAGENDRGVPVVRLKKMPRKREKVISFLIKCTCVFLISLTCIAAILFTIREFDIWWSLSYCEVKQCDEAVLTFSDNSSHSSFCRAKGGRVASSLLLEHTEQTCGNPSNPFVENGVFLNETFNFSDWYAVMDFQIHLTDFAEEIRGTSLFRIGFSLGSIYINETTEKFEWNLIRSKSKESLELFNTLNEKIASISATSQSKIVMKYRILKDNRRRIIKIANRENKEILDTYHIHEKYPTLFVYFQFCEKSFARISVKSLSDRIAFNAQSMFSNVYLSNNNKTARNYFSPNEVDVTKKQKQQVSI